MTDKEIMEKCTKEIYCVNGYKAEAVFDKIEDVLFKDNDKIGSNFYLLMVNKLGEAMQSFIEERLLRMTVSEILSVNMECFTKEYKIVLMVKSPKPTYLDKVEENYLRNIIAPLWRSGCRNFKVRKTSMNDKLYYIIITMYNTNSGWPACIDLPSFKKSSNMYKNLSIDKSYPINYLVE